eukprot:GHRR01034386.1.p1 GENE.GHRR01034386.1~~GHRR01034386.1.p1  ORF type:complete len:140 (+),score=29.99 GHRR01034386.1:443-862(+)
MCRKPSLDHSLLETMLHDNVAVHSLLLITGTLLAVMPHCMISTPARLVQQPILSYNCFVVFGLQLHYPFENKALFEANFPADFVAEGLDQTRGWFYTLMVLSSALFDKPAFKNLVCNGLVLAADGKKMSKRLKNYPVGY